MPNIKRGIGKYTGRVVSGVQINKNHQEYFTVDAIDAAPLTAGQPLMTVTCNLPLDAGEAPKVGSFVTVEIRGREEVGNAGFRPVKTAIGTLLEVKKVDMKTIDPSKWEMQQVVDDGELRKFIPRQRLLLQDAAN
jgi:hypothetical protein